MNWKFWTWVSWKCRITPERMEEICKALETHLRSGGEARSMRHSTGQLRTASMTSNLAGDSGVPYKDLWQFLWQFRRHATPEMRERLILADREGKKARSAKRMAEKEARKSAVPAGK